MDLGLYYGGFGALCVLLQLRNRQRRSGICFPEGKQDSQGLEPVPLRGRDRCFR